MASTAVVLSSGPRIRTDEVTSAAGVSNHVQFVKLVAPAAGSTAPITTANPLAVLLQSSTATVTIQGNASVALTSAGVGGSTANPLVVAQAPVIDHVYQSTTPLGLNYTSINVTASGIVQIVASATGRILVLSAQFTALSSCNFQWSEGASAAASGLTGVQAIAANGFWSLPYSPVGHFRTATGLRLNLGVQGTTGGIGGSLVWVRPTN